MSPANPAAGSAWPAFAFRLLARNWHGRGKRANFDGVPKLCARAVCLDSVQHHGAFGAKLHGIDSREEVALRLAIGSGEARAATILAHPGLSHLGAAKWRPPRARCQSKCTTRFSASIPVSTRVERMTPTARREHSGHCEGHGDMWQQHHRDAANEGGSALLQLLRAPRSVSGDQGSGAGGVIRDTRTLYS
eukprot:scaffold122179_cov27-Tisochrysis_lutea.AAC.4